MGLTRNVIKGDKAERLLVVLHGLGADERDLAPLVPHIDPEGHFLSVLLRGQYSAPPGYAWFHFGDPSLTASTLGSSVDAVDETLDDLCFEYGHKREEAVLAGFSQGAALALALALRESERPRPSAVLAMSGFLPPEGGAVTYGWTTGELPAVLMQHGTQDPLIPVDAGRESARALTSKGVPVVWREYPMEHNVTLESVRDAAAWLDRVRGGERPSEEVPSEAVTPEPAPDDDALVREVSSATFDREVLQSPVPVIVDFWAPWCQPCRAVAPVVEQIAAMRKGSYKVVKINIDQAQDLAQRYEIQSIPLVALFRNGRMERKSLGAKPRPQLEAELGMLVIP